MVKNRLQSLGWAFKIHPQSLVLAVAKHPLVHKDYFYDNFIR